MRGWWRGVALATFLILLLSPVPADAKSHGAKSANIGACKQGGWRSLATSNGRAFKNQGACVSYAARGGTVSTAVTCGDTISTPGSYFLAASCGPGEITITVSNVTLLLNGHTMTGPPAGGGIGVVAEGSAGPLSGLKLLGPGTITNYAVGLSLGIGGFGVNGSVVSGLSADNNGEGIKLVLSDDNTVQSNTADNNGEGIDVFGGTGNRVNANNTNDNNAGFGIFLLHGTTGNTINGNTADNNRGGIAVQPGSTGNTISANSALGNSPFDLFDGNPGCDSNVWQANDFVTANQSCIH